MDHREHQHKDQERGSISRAEREAPDTVYPVEQHYAEDQQRNACEDRYQAGSSDAYREFRLSVALRFQFF